MEGNFSNLGYKNQEKHDLEWGYYMMNFIPGAWDVIARNDIDQNTNFVCFSHPDKYVEYTVNEVIFHLNEFTVRLVMRTMEKISKNGWLTYKKEREIAF